MIRDCVTSKLRLPDLKGIRIERISDSDTDLARFLSDCIPTSLYLLAVNCWAKNYIKIKSKFYIDSFSEAARRTTKEVYFQCIDFSAEDLQTVVRAAHNAERIVFRQCCINSSSRFDFGADLSYNTKFLSFQWWGNTSCEEKAMDWDAEPLGFSLILDAIGSSGLRASLQKLSFAFNETLSVPKVQEELNAKGMSHIFVVQESPFPLSS